MWDINSGIDTQMLNQLIATRVAEALAAAAVTHAASTQEETNLGSNSSQNKTCNYKEFRAVMHENFRGTEGDGGLTDDGALTWWNVYVHSVTLDTAHATPWSDFKAMSFGCSYAGKLPHCGKCGRHHIDAFALLLITIWGRGGHKAKDCRAPPRPANQRGPGSQGGQGTCHCFGCDGKKDLTQDKCPNNGNQGGGKSNPSSTNKSSEQSEAESEGNLRE
ncbi:hypothetical protein Tco_0227449 [Tanacetum coccineum]